MPHIYRNAWAALILFITLLLLTTGRPVHAAPELTVGDYQLVSSKRISRTVSEYAYKAAVINTGSDALDVSATLNIDAPGVTVLDGELSFGDVGAGATVSSTDMFTIRHDRAYAYNESLLEWTIFTTTTTTTKLNDTGITTCSGNLGDLFCPVSGFPGQDAEHGRDALAAAGLLQKVGGGSAGFDFTKLDADGNPLPANASEWSCVKDNHTGLIWEVKTTSGLRNMHHTYTWYNPDSSTNGGDPGVQDGGSCSESSCDTHGYVQAVNAQGLCGANDWRMPAREELRGIGDYSLVNPTIDTAYFPHTLSGIYWSASPDAGSVSDAWIVSFLLFDSGSSFRIKALDSHVRLVRGGQ